jgi:SAM-dependent methyltransferase
MTKLKAVRQAQEKIFRDLYNNHKGSPMAVSSESLEHKRLRFTEILRIVDGCGPISIHDVGCGIGDLGAFSRRELDEGVELDYSGTEILPEFIEEAKKRFPDSKFYVRDLAEKPADELYDYVVLSGVFHQRRDTRIPDWEQFSQRLLRNCFKMAKRGIAFNFISPFVDFYQEQVYYCNLQKMIQFVVDDLSRFFEVRHSYALFEFTVFVYREEYVAAKHPQEEFQKYFRIKK